MSHAQMTKKHGKSIATHYLSAANGLFSLPILLSIALFLWHLHLIAPKYWHD